MLTCQETVAIQAYIVMYSHSSKHQTLISGQLMQWLDVVGGISAVQLSRSEVVTASLDSLDFLAPLQLGHAVRIKSYVSGVGKRSIEVFLKVTGEDLLTGEKYLANTSFMTFVVKRKGIELPQIQPETKEEKFICSKYQERRAVRNEKMKESLLVAKNVDIKAPWTIHR